MLAKHMRPHTTGEYNGTANAIVGKSENVRKCITAQTGSNRKTHISSSVEFIDKIRFSARTDSSWRRSRSFLPRVYEKTYDVWKLPPPNFNPQAFAVTLPERNSRECVMPETHTSASNGRYENQKQSAADRKKDHRREDELKTLALAASSIRIPESTLKRRPDFTLSFHVPKTYEMKANSIRNSTYKPGIYEMPKLHDFRQYPPIRSLGLPEFITAYERDASGLKFKSKQLRIMTDRVHPVQRDIEPGPSMASAISLKPSWEKELILPKHPYPNKHYAFSRHRRMDRSTRSAYLENAGKMLEKRTREIAEWRKLTERKTKSTPSQHFANKSISAA